LIVLGVVVMLVVADSSNYAAGGVNSRGVVRGVDSDIGGGGGGGGGIQFGVHS
jgi:hypothetical protein